MEDEIGTILKVMGIVVVAVCVSFVFADAVSSNPPKPGFYDCKDERTQIFECLSNLAECRMEAK